MIMATINDKLTYIEGTKDAIKQALIAKGVSVQDSDTFRSYADKIGSIETGGGTTFTDGTKFSYSKWSTIPNELIPYLECTSDMGYMFNNCTSLTTVPLFNTTNANNMSFMLSNCFSLTAVPLFDTRNVTNMSYMLASCSNLTTVPQFDTSNVTDMSYMFQSCYRLTTVPQFDTRNVTDMSGMFLYCSKLTTLGGFTSLKLDFSLSFSSKLTVDSVMNVITNAADMTTSPKTLTLHADVFAKLTEEQIATANAKGWNIAS